MAQITTDLTLAIQTLKAGNPIAIPTETVYGLAAPIDNEEAIRRVFQLKNRPLDHPLIVHVHPSWDLLQWVETISKQAQQLIQAFWPGPLTLVFKQKKDALSALITGGQSTVAIRCPAHPLTQELLNELGTPLVAPSANPFGKVSPTTPQHVYQSFSDCELLILEGGRCSVGIESTIVNISEADYYQILRQGMVHEEQINEILQQPSCNYPNSIRVPGKLDSHYQPEKSLYYFENAEALNAFCSNTSEALFVIAQNKPNAPSVAIFHPYPQTAEEMAYQLYYQLKEADQSQVEKIVMLLPEDNHGWKAIRERIIKAGRPAIY